MKQIAPGSAWAAISPNGRIGVWSIRPTRAEVIKRVPLGAIPADDYRRLGPVRSWRKCYRDGWRVIRVIVRPFGAPEATP